MDSEDKLKAIVIASLCLFGAVVISLGLWAASMLEIEKEKTRQMEIEHGITNDE